MKIFTACLGTETNTFSPIPTGMGNFSETCLIRDGQYGTPPFLFAGPLAVFRDEARRRGWEVAESLCAFAQPAGLTTASVYESLRDEILSDLEAASPVDIVLLSLHGAMVAVGYLDCEGDLLRRIRDLVGPEVTIGAELDLHAHLTEQMVAHADVLISFKEYPHIDYMERAMELFEISIAVAKGEVRPIMNLYDPHMVGVYHTNREPMSSILRAVEAAEGDPEVLTVSIIHGFPWGDVPEMGTKILVITNNSRDKGKALAEDLGQRLSAHREDLTPDFLDFKNAVSKVKASDDGPVVIADCSDNPGGGAAGDSTFILQEILDQGIDRVVIGCLWDPVATSFAFEAGEGAVLEMRLGGKAGPYSGTPIDLEVEVVRLVEDSVQLFGLSNHQVTLPLGNLARLRGAGLDILIHSIRSQTLSLTPFYLTGIEPDAQRCIVLKSAQHFYHDFHPMASEIIYAATPGVVTPHYSTLDYRRLDRPIWPIE